jgi:hypothetical protein
MPILGHEMHYFLQPERLYNIWEEILHITTHTPDTQDFRDPWRFFSAKGTKLQFKTSPSHPTILGTIDNFQAYFERIIDLEYVFLDRFYVDLGKEICASISLLPDARGTIDSEAQVWLQRTDSFGNPSRSLRPSRSPYAVARTSGEHAAEVTFRISPSQPFTCRVMLETLSLSYGLLQLC